MSREGMRNAQMFLIIVLLVLLRRVPLMLALPAERDWRSGMGDGLSDALVAERIPKDDVGKASAQSEERAVASSQASARASRSYPAQDPADGTSPWEVQAATSISQPNVQISVTAGAVSGFTEFVVNQMRAGGYTTVQEAVDAVPDGNQQRVLIKIDSGTYVEKVNIPSGKNFITFSGDESGAPMITWNDTAASAGSTYDSATVAVDADHFIAENIIFENSAPAPPAGASGMQGVALRIGGDMAAFYNSSFLGAQDTLCDWMGRHYFKNCTIQGSIDFIFGAGQSFYEGCTIKSIATDFGSITAHYRQDGADASGYSFINCTISGTGSVVLGRAWGSFARVVFTFSSMSGVIDPVGWNDWDDSSRDEYVQWSPFMLWLSIWFRCELIAAMVYKLRLLLINIHHH